MAQGQREIAVVGVGSTSITPAGRPASGRQLPRRGRRLGDRGRRPHKRDIDGVLVCEHSEDVKIAYRVFEHLGMSGRAKPLCLAITNGGIAAAVANKVATWALLSGEANYVLVVGGGGGARGRASERAMRPGTYMQGSTTSAGSSTSSTARWARPASTPCTPSDTCTSTARSRSTWRP